MTHDYDRRDACGRTSDDHRNAPAAASKSDHEIDLPVAVKQHDHGAECTRGRFNYLYTLREEHHPRSSPQVNELVVTRYTYTRRSPALVRSHKLYAGAFMLCYLLE